MGFFSKESPFDQSVDKATLETNTKEDWALILDICDKVSTSPQAPKECLRSIIRRLNHPDPHVAIQAIVLLDACVSNCGKAFHLEIASREFDHEFQKILMKTSERTLRDRLLATLEKWALAEFKNDPQLSLIPALYNKLKQNGAEFPSMQSPSKGGKKSGSHQSSHKSKGHSATTSASQKEEEDLAKAIELSLKETQNASGSRSLYPQAGLASVGGGSVSSPQGTNNGSNAAAVEPRRVRALYDFEAAEDNELTFYAGEIVHVTDDTDTNWWQGTNQRGTGLFPANFVTADLSAEPQRLEPAARRTVQFNDEVEVQEVEREPEVVEIDEAKIDRTLHILHEADPTGETPDPSELASLEDQVQQMGPLIDQELERIDRRHAQLTRLGTELVDALNMYHHLMREVGPPQGMGMGYNPGMSGPGGQHYPPMPTSMGPPGAWPGNPYYPPMSYGPPNSMPPVMINPGLPHPQQVTSPTQSGSPMHIPNIQQQQHQQQMGPPPQQQGQVSMGMMPPMGSQSHAGIMQGQPMMVQQVPAVHMSMPHLQQDPVTMTTMSTHGQHQHMSMPQQQVQYPPPPPQHSGIQYQIPAPPQQFYQLQSSTNAMM